MGFSGVYWDFIGFTGYWNGIRMEFFMGSQCGKPHDVHLPFGDGFPASINGKTMGMVCDIGFITEKNPWEHKSFSRFCSPIHQHFIGIVI